MRCRALTIQNEESARSFPDWSPKERLSREIAMSFKDRADAARKLVLALADYKNHQPVILALPRGGVPVAAKVAAALNAPLDLILVRKIGVPYQPELAMGAVVDGEKPLVVRNEDVIRFAGIADSEFNAVCDSELAEIERRRQRYLGSRERVEVAGRTAIVIDDGIATGATTRAALRATRMRKPRKLILAVPVASCAFPRTEDHIACDGRHRYFAPLVRQGDAQKSECQKVRPQSDSKTQCRSRHSTSAG